MRISTLKLLLPVAGLWFGIMSCTVTAVAPFGSERAAELEQDEKRLWKMASDEQEKLDRSARLYEDPVFSEYLNEVGQRLLKGRSELKELSFRFKVVKNPLLNAFSYPNGVVYVHTGLLAKMDNEAQLAAVLAHEIVHVTHRHTLQAFRNMKNAAAFLTTLQVIGAPAGLPGAGVFVLGAIGTLAAVSGYSKGAEEEADREGINMMIGAGYDASDAPKLFDAIKRDLEEQKITEPFFFGTHPRLQERQESYSRLLKERAPELPGEKCAERFAEKLLPLLLENAQLDLAMGRFVFAEDALQKYLQHRPQSAEGHYWLAEVFRQRWKEEDKAKVEKEYLAAGQDEPYAPAYKGLGLVYLKQGAKEKALDHFRKYLLLAPDAKDKDYIQNYLRDLVEREKLP